MTRPDFSLSSAHVNGRTMLRVFGEVDIATSPRLAEAMGLLDGPLDVDCGALEFIDAAGLGVLAGAARSHGSVMLRHPSALLRRIVDTCGLGEVLRVSPSTPEPGEGKQITQPP
jgi:anti-anti-sigma factor